MGIVYSGNLRRFGIETKIKAPYITFVFLITGLYLTESIAGTIKTGPDSFQESRSTPRTAYDGSILIRDAVAFGARAKTPHDVRATGAVTAGRRDGFRRIQGGALKNRQRECARPPLANISCSHSELVVGMAHQKTNKRRDAKRRN
ncbi:hypothetical protein EVAR_68956_1 [Eumeta japonica]|uniref:Uncharacterized protein n=1 Tax=Eumeta variegata TaxID=151549 RepID=A0A4C2AE29_EUMVA|nr:hypothetical protein EVAR_68956_1 [Eumeta japonica]